MTIVNVTPVRSRTLMPSGSVESESMSRRCKLQTPSEQHLKTGDLVWIVEETNPRGYNPTALIVELRYGSDSVARSAVLHTSTSSLVPPLVKLVPVFPTSSMPKDVTK